MLLATCHGEYKQQKCSRYPEITSFINFGQRSLIILNFGLAVKAQAVPNEHKMRIRFSLTLNVNVSVGVNECEFGCGCECYFEYSCIFSSAD